MHILFLSDNFPPETNAPASRLYEHASYWVRLGHQVTVITCAPNFPEGKIFPGYRNRWYAVEAMNGIRVVRVKTYITANEGFLKRILDYVSFMAMGFLAGLFQKNPDVVVATSPQFFAAVGGWMLAAVRRRPFVFELRDLWPAQIVAVGVIRDKSLTVALLEKLELFLYKQATAVVAVTQSFKAHLIARGIPAEKIAVIYNGVDLERYKPRPRDEELATQFGVQDKFIVGYLGTHGLNQGLDRVLETAELLHDREDIIFLFVGAGAERKALIETANQKALKKVLFIPLQPKEMMPRLWSLCNVTLIPLKDRPLYTKMIPSKLFEMMGMGLPILLAMPEGEATGIVRQTGAGIVVPPEQPEALAAAILELFAHPQRLETLCRASHIAAKYFSRTKQAEEMLTVLQSIVKAKKEAAKEYI